MRYITLFIIVLAALLVGCTAEQSVERQAAPAQDVVAEPTSIESSGPTADAVSEESGDDSNPTVVVMSDNEFRPHSVTIKAGQSVEFVNKDGFSHTATGDEWDTGTMAKGQSEIIAFDEPGTYEYVCRFHSNMRGEIIVE